MSICNHFYFSSYAQLGIFNSMHLNFSRCKLFHRVVITTEKEQVWNDDYSELQRNEHKTGVWCRSGRIPFPRLVGRYMPFFELWYTIYRPVRLFTIPIENKPSSYYRLRFLESLSSRSKEAKWDLKSLASKLCAWPPFATIFLPSPRPG